MDGISLAKDQEACLARSSIEKWATPIQMRVLGLGDAIPEGLNSLHITMISPN